MLRDALAAKPAEVNDPLDAFLLGHAGEVARSRLLSLGEPAAAAHCVHEVVGDHYVAASTNETPLVGDVALVQSEAGGLKLPRLCSITNQAAHRRLRLGQRFRQPAADEAGCSGNEGRYRDLL